MGMEDVEWQWPPLWEDQFRCPIWIWWTLKDDQNQWKRQIYEDLTKYYIVNIGEKSPEGDPGDQHT